jgi:hypothetical protein
VPPKGIRCFAPRSISQVGMIKRRICFSAPKGIRCFATRAPRADYDISTASYVCVFQCPAGH